MMILRDKGCDEGQGLVRELLTYGYGLYTNGVVWKVRAAWGLPRLTTYGK